MKEETNYNNYTFEDDAKVVFSKAEYNQILNNLAQIHNTYREDFPGTVKERSMADIKFAFTQKTDENETTVFTGHLFMELRKALRKSLNKEVVLMAPLAKHYVNNKTSRIVKKLPKGQDDKYTLTVDPAKTSDHTTLQEFVTQTGQALLRLNDKLDNVLRTNVDAGNGITFEELAKKSKEADMQPV